MTGGLGPSDGTPSEGVRTTRHCKLGTSEREGGVTETLRRPNSFVTLQGLSLSREILPKKLLDPGSTERFHCPFSIFLCQGRNRRKNVKTTHGTQVDKEKKGSFVSDVYCTTNHCPDEFYGVSILINVYDRIYFISRLILSFRVSGCDNEITSLISFRLIRRQSGARTLWKRGRTCV